MPNFGSKRYVSLPNARTLTEDPAIGLARLAAVQASRPLRPVPRRFPERAVTAGALEAAAAARGYRRSLSVPRAGAELEAEPPSLVEAC